MVFGFERGPHFSGINRHLLHAGSLLGMLSEFSRTKARPALLNQTNIFQKDLLRNKLTKKVPNVAGKPATNIAMDFGIISLPTNLCV